MGINGPVEISDLDYALHFDDPVPEEPDIPAYVDAASALIGLKLDPAHRAGVRSAEGARPRAALS